MQSHLPDTSVTVKDNQYQEIMNPIFMQPGIILFNDLWLKTSKYGFSGDSLL